MTTTSVSFLVFCSTSVFVYCSLILAVVFTIFCDSMSVNKTKLRRCCRCNGSDGRRRNCSCVKRGSSCSCCLPGDHGVCHNQHDSAHPPSSSSSPSSSTFFPTLCLLHLIITISLPLPFSRAHPFPLSLLLSTLPSLLFYSLTSPHYSMFLRGLETYGLGS